MVAKILRFLTAAPRRFWAYGRSKPKRTIAGVILVLLILFGIGSCTRPTEPDYLTQVVLRQNLQQSVEAVGTVISERDLTLQFPITGVVQTVNVSEGDRVKAGQELARLRSSGLSADVSSASAQVQAARADLARLEEGTRPEELAVAEASVQNKRASLETARSALATAERTLIQATERLDVLNREAEINLSGYVSTAQSTISQNVAAAQNALRSLEAFDNDNDIRHTTANFYGEPEFQRLINDRRDQIAALDTVSRNGAYFTDYRSAQVGLEQATNVMRDSADLISRYYAFISSLPINSVFSNEDREAAKSTVASQQTSIQSAYSSTESALSSLRDAAAGLDSRIAGEEANLLSAEGSRDRAKSDIQTFETSLKIEEANLNLKKAGSRSQDIASARANLNQAFASLQRAQERFRDTVLIAPIDGVVTKVALKAGELLSTSFASEAAITMLGDEPFRVELFVAEIDVPKVSIGQTGSILLDAFASQPFVLRVSELEPAATEIDGVPKYRAKMDFVTPDERMKIGMTGDTEIFTDFRADVLVVPGRAIFENDSGESVVRVLNPETNEMTEKVVTTGMEGDGGDVEILSGLEEGEIVVELVRE